MRIKLMTACAVVSLTLLSAIAGAQTTPTATGGANASQSTGAAPLSKSDLVDVPVWPKSIVALPEGQQPVATSFALGQVEGIKPELISGVTANGYARKVAVEGQSIGQVLVMSVAKDGKEEVISNEGMSAQFDASETSQLFPETSLNVEGSKAALVSALEKLATTEKKDDAKKEVKDATDENAVGSNASGNDLASSYKTPTPTTLAATEEEPVITYEMTTDGCKVRPDLTQEKAFVQNKTQTFSDGVLSEETECTDSDVSYPIKKSFNACATEDKVDLDGMTAWSQFKWYYADDQGETHTISEECIPDEETPYTITEVETCPIDLDFDAKIATPQSQLVYVNRSGATVPARGCQPSTLSQPIPMTESASACPLRHVYAESKSYELSLWTYVRNGVSYQAAPCTDTGRTFDHDTIYTDATGAYVCQPINDLTGKTATLQSRKQITIDGVPQYITECTPDTASRAIQATTDGCMDPSKWNHDLDAGLSYGQERFWFAKADGTPYYVTACQTSAVTYQHDHAIVGYQNHDLEGYAYPLMKVTINVSGAPYTVKSSELLAGAQQMIYLPADPAMIDKQNGAATYEGCNAFYTTTRYEQWERPDGTIYEKAIGDGTPVGPSDVCSTTQETAGYTQVSYSNTLRTNAHVTVQNISIMRMVKTNPNTHETFAASPVTNLVTPVVSVSGGSYCPTGANSQWVVENGNCDPEGMSSTGVSAVSNGCGSSTIYGTVPAWSYDKNGSFTCNWSPTTAHDWQ